VSYTLFEMIRKLRVCSICSYDRDEETESETKIRMPEDEYDDNMESAGNKKNSSFQEHLNKYINEYKTTLEAFN
jgi:hypothetical protein